MIDFLQFWFGFMLFILAIVASPYIIVGLVAIVSIIVQLIVVAIFASLVLIAGLIMAPFAFICGLFDKDGII